MFFGIFPVRGRKPTPLNLRVIQGNPGKRRLPKNLQLDPGIPQPPDFLDKEAIAEWHRIIKVLEPSRVIALADRAALAAYCCNYSRWAQAQRKLQELGTLLHRTAAGAIIQSPYVGISNRAMELMHKFLTEFGLTPVSRARVAAAGGDDRKNPFAEIG